MSDCRAGLLSPLFRGRAFKNQKNAGGISPATDCLRLPGAAPRISSRLLEPRPACERRVGAINRSRGALDRGGSEGGRGRGET